MSIITFWNNGREQVGKTLAIASIVTELSIEHNKKVLIISTSINDDTLKNCFWADENVAKKDFGGFGGIFGKQSNIGIENGIDGLNKILKSNKISPNIITDYTKIVFKDRLEILLGYTGPNHIYEEIQESYLDIIKLANQYYDYVFVDLDNGVNEINKREILNCSNVIVMPMSQRLISIGNYQTAIDQDYVDTRKVIPLICRYDKKSKYTAKNVARYIGKKKELNIIPYNTLLFEATEEGKIVDLFLKIRKIDDTDKNAYFLREIKKMVEAIDYKIHELQMR